MNSHLRCQGLAVACPNRVYRRNATWVAGYAGLTVHAGNAWPHRHHQDVSRAQPWQDYRESRGAGCCQLLHYPVVRPDRSEQSDTPVHRRSALLRQAAQTLQPQLSSPRRRHHCRPGRPQAAQRRALPNPPRSELQLGKGCRICITTKAADMRKRQSTGYVSPRQRCRFTCHLARGIARAHWLTNTS